MPIISLAEATETLARSVEKAGADDLVEIYAELFPERPSPSPPSAVDIVWHIRHGLEPDEVVGLWNVVFPRDRNVWYNEEEGSIYLNEESLWYVE
jgi:hypothetical protein